jgi:hypothetical protein
MFIFICLLLYLFSGFFGAGTFYQSQKLEDRCYEITDDLVVYATIIGLWPFVLASLSGSYLMKKWSEK